MQSRTDALTIRLTRLMALFESGELRQILLLLTVATLDGLLQALGIASIMPFIAILADPSLAESSRFFILLSELLPATFQDHLVSVTGSLALFVLVISNAVTILNYYLSLRLFNEQRSRLSTRLLSLYMGKELLNFNSRKVSEMSTTILSEVERAVIDTLMAAVNVIADTIVTLAIVALLLFVNPWATVVTVAVLGGGYLVVHLLHVREVERLGLAHADAKADMFASVSQALSLFKEAKILAKESYFIRRFERPARDVARITNRYEILTFVPAQLTEVLAFGLILIVALYLTGQNDADFNAIGALAFYAFAAYRIVPVLKSLLDGVEAIRYGGSVVERLLDELETDTNHTFIRGGATGRFSLHESIVLEQVAFRYPGAATSTFEGLNALIPVGRLTCIVGPSGAGKSTLLDILLGLIEPTVGRVLIDGAPLHQGNRHQWHSGIGYVPQQVQLLNGTLAQNIALGETEIDETRIEAAAKAAGIHRFADERLPQRYGTLIGDGGHTLSSGERQRVGIARALYHSPSVLLLDEATNELDAATEDLVLSHLLGRPDTTIVFVTHKQALWKRADTIIQLAGNSA